MSHKRSHRSKHDARRAEGSGVVHSTLEPEFSPHQPETLKERHTDAAEPIAPPAAPLPRGFEIAGFPWQLVVVLGAIALALLLFVARMVSVF